jgi:hypothetical protein
MQLVVRTAQTVIIAAPKLKEVEEINSVLDEFEGDLMNGFKYLAIAAVAAMFVAAGTPKAEAQISVNLGVAPACPYGYYDYTPYQCAPYGYYGPEWFHGRAFIGAGPWFHGRDEFRGHVDTSFDPQRGYSGRFPNNGERATQRSRAPRTFKGNEMRDGRGHANGENHGEEKR